MENIDIIRTVGGTPFIDNQFDPAKMLTAVAITRAHLCNADVRSFDELAQFVNPVLALKIAHEHYESHPPIISAPLTDIQTQDLKMSIEKIIQEIPQWKSLLDGPFIFMYLETHGLYSLTNPVVPQFIFFGSEAFVEKHNLGETIVHEMAHVWMGLIHEVSPLVQENDHEVFTLPSGTSGKSTLGTLLATHFAGAALSYHMRRREVNTPRMIYLSRYLEGCINILESAKGLTPCAIKILDSIKVFYDKRAHIIQ